MKYRSKVVWCLCLLLAGLGIVAVVPRVAHAQGKLCTCCKGTGKNLCKVCGGRGCAQCNWKGEVIDLSAINTPEAAARILMDITTCTCCNGTGKIYTPAEKAAMKKAADTEKAKQAAAAEAERVRIEKAVQAASGTFTDSRDDKTYKKIAIGTQTWMAQNLNYDIPDDAMDVCYENRPDSCAKYGRLYNWNTAMNGAPSSKANPSGVQGVCPSGWHLPSAAEWRTLLEYVEKTSGCSYCAGAKLKSTSGWIENGNGTDEYGFSALPGGYSDRRGDFENAEGKSGQWWSTTEDNRDKAWQRYMWYYKKEIGGSDSPKTDRYSVRCVQD